MYLLLFNITKIIIKSILITHPLYFDCIITNNPPCIVCLQLIWLKITERFWKTGLLAHNKVNNTRALFEVKLPIKIQSMPHPGIGQLLTLNGYIRGLAYFT